MTPNRELAPIPEPAAPAGGAALPGAGTALALLLAINLFNYIDRQVLSAVLPKLRLDAELFAPDDPWLRTKLGSLTTAFMVTYMLLSPLFGWLGDRRSRWTIVGLSVILWSLASGASGLAVSFAMLLLTRCLVGVGEAAYGPVAPAMLSDLYPLKRRGRIMALFYMAIPVGSALGFIIGGQVADTAWGWRGAFFVVVLPGVLLGVLCLFMTEPPREHAAKPGFRLGDYGRVLRMLLRIPSFRLNTLAMTCSTFVLGGVAAWMPFYIFEREARFVVTPQTLEDLRAMQTSAGTPVVPPGVVEKLGPLASEPAELDMGQLQLRLAEVLTPREVEQYNSYIFDKAAAPGSPTLGWINLIFGAIVVVSGLGATILGGYLGDRLRERWPGSYFLVSGAGMLLGLPFFVAMLFVPFPLAWGVIFLAVFCLFLNTGPANTILANVVHPGVRATAFAINILIIHLFGDAVSPMIIGGIADLTNLPTAFLVIAGLVAVSGVLWTWGARHLQRDTELAPTREVGGG